MIRNTIPNDKDVTAMQTTTELTQKDQRDTATKIDVMSRATRFFDMVRKATAEEDEAWRPPPGTYACSVDDVRFKPRKFTWKKPNKGSLPGHGLQVVYTVNDTSAGQDSEGKDINGRQFPGKLFVFPTCSAGDLAAGLGDEDGPCEGQYTRIFIATGQLKSLLAKLLGVVDPNTIDDFGAHVGLLLQDITARKSEGRDPLCASVKILESEDPRSKEMRFDREQITQALESAV